MKDRRALFGSTAAAVEPEPVFPANTNEEYEENTYQAFKESRPPVPRLRLRFANGNTKTFSYHHLVTSDCISDEQLALHFDTHVVMLEGSHLDVLDDYFVDERIRELYEFHQGKYSEPPSGKPHITSIIVQTLNEIAGR